MSLKFKMDHENYNVADLETSIEFYKKALGLEVIRRSKGDYYNIAFLGNDESEFRLELTQLYDHPQKYDIGEEEFHLAFATDDFKGMYEMHKEMGVICFENPAMGVYFIMDPDGYWLEITDAKD